MAVGDSRDVGGPQLRYSRPDDAPLPDRLTEALDLARRVEELLEDTRSISVPVSVPGSGSGVGLGDRLEASTHSTRMARAMAASLVDELEVLARPSRSSGAA